MGLNELAKQAADHRERALAVIVEPEELSQQHATAQALLAVEARLGMLCEILGGRLLSM